MPGPKTEEPKTEEAKLTRVVARGRSLVVDGKTCVAGAEVQIAASEVPELTAHGFLIEPDAPAAPVPEGPQVTRG